MITHFPTNPGVFSQLSEDWAESVLGQRDWERGNSARKFSVASVCGGGLFSSRWWFFATPLKNDGVRQLG